MFMEQNDAYFWHDSFLILEESLTFDNIVVQTLQSKQQKCVSLPL
jgi:hypothetical protein